MIRVITSLTGEKDFFFKIQIKFLLYWSWYRLGEASWRSPPALKHIVQGCVGGELMATCDNLSDSGFESLLRHQKARTSTTRPFGQKLLQV